MQVTLNAQEIARLCQQDPNSKSDGGWQSLIVGSQGKLDQSTGNLTLSADDLRRIPKYAFDYKSGGWEDTLIAVFSRTLGPKLGRP